MGGSVDRRTFLTSAVLGSASVVAGVNLLSSSAPAAAIGSGRPIQSAAPNFGLTKFLDPLRIPPAIQSYSRRYQDELTITMSNARSRLHSQLPETTLWTYEGQFPGPTIEVRGNRQLRVAWANELEGTVPLVAVRAPYAQPSPANLPGYRNPDGSLPANASATHIADPPRTVPANPDFTQVCAPSGLDSSARCIQSALQAIDNARAAEGVKAMVLPTGFASLTVAQQLFVGVNLERVDRGLPPFTGLTAGLNANAQRGADIANDPPDPGTDYDVVDTEWAGGSSNGLDAVYGWMYDDGGRQRQP